MKFMKLKTFSFLCLAIVAIQATAQTRQETVNNLLTSAKEQTIRPSGALLVGNDEGLQLLFSADSIVKTQNDTLGQAAIADQIGLYYYGKDADKSIKYYLEAYPLYMAVNNKKRVVQCLSNIAFAYDEQKHNYPDAIKYTKMSIDIRRAIMDTLGTGNMCKYLGYLQGKTHDYEEAKKNVAEAIRLFSLKNYTPGIAVCYRDLATVYEESGNADSCIINILQAQNIWAGTHDTLRIFDANNILIRVYTAGNRLQEAENIFHKNEAMMNARSLRNMRRAYMEILDYYKICQAYFSKKKDDKMTAVYLAKYNEYKTEAQQKGFHLEGY